MSNNFNEEDFFQNETLTVIEPELAIVPDDNLVHYAMSFLLEIPLYAFSNSQRFGSYPIKQNGETILLQKINPFVLIPIITCAFEGPPEALVMALPDPNNPQSFNPNAVGQGLTRRFTYTARQNLKKLLDIYGDFGVVSFDSLIGRADGQKICDIVLPINNREIFPIQTRTYRATTRRGNFTDQVAEYLNTSAAKNIEKMATSENYEVCVQLHREMQRAAEIALNRARKSVDEIIIDIKKNQRAPFSFLRGSENEVYPADFMMLANLDMPEPDAKPVTNQPSSQSAGNTNYDALMAEVIRGQNKMSSILQMMIANNLSTPPDTGDSIPTSPAAADGVTARKSTEGAEPKENEISELFTDSATPAEKLSFGQKMAIARQRKKDAETVETVETAPLGHA